MRLGLPLSRRTENPVGLGTLSVTPVDTSVVTLAEGRPAPRDGTLGVKAGEGVPP